MYNTNMKHPNRTLEQLKTEKVKTLKTQKLEVLILTYVIYTNVRVLGA